MWGINKIIRLFDNYWNLISTSTWQNFFNSLKVLANQEKTLKHHLHTQVK